MDSSVSPKDGIWFLRVCHHILNAVYLSHYPSISVSGTNLLTLDTANHEEYAIHSEVYKLPISLNVQCPRFHCMDLTYSDVV